MYGKNKKKKLSRNIHAFKIEIRKLAKGSEENKMLAAKLCWRVMSRHATANSPFMHIIQLHFKAKELAWHYFHMGCNPVNLVNHGDYYFEDLDDYHFEVVREMLALYYSQNYIKKIEHTLNIIGNEKNPSLALKLGLFRV